MRNPTRLAFVALLCGAAALVAFAVQSLVAVHHPLLILGSNLGFAAGVYGLLLLCDPWLRDAGNAGILQFLGFLAIALLGRVWLGQTAQGVAILFEYSLSLGAMAITIGLAGFRALCTRFSAARAATANGVVGAAAFLGLALVLLTTSQTRTAPNAVLLGLACVIVASLLAAQWFVARGLHWRPARVWTTPLALALVGTQLFDGVLTYLVVEDPLGIAPAGFEERIPASRFILDRFGIGFPIAKWVIGLGVAFVLAGTPFRRPTHRVVLYLAIFAAGMGPGLFSAAQLT